jgi:hypothetical protein
LRAALGSTKSSLPTGTLTMTKPLSSDDDRGVYGLDDKDGRGGGGLQVDGPQLGGFGPSRATLAAAIGSSPRQ